MWKIFLRTPLAVIFAVLVHVVFFVLLLVSMDWSYEPVVAPVSKVDPVKATVVDGAQVAEELLKLKRADEAKRKAEKDKAQLAKKKLDDLKRKQDQEKKALAKLESERKKKLAAEKTRQEKIKKEKALAAAKDKSDKLARTEELKKIKQAQVEEKARLEKLKQEQAELQKQKALEAKHLAEIEEKRKAEEKAAKEAEEKRKAEAKRLAEEKKKRDAELAKQKAIEEEARLKAKASADQALVERYVALIKQKIERNWLQPANTSGRSSTLQVRLIPGGEVADVRTIRSSGDPGFDRSVEVAVFKASPLDLPADPELFARFRELKFVFRADD